MLTKTELRLAINSLQADQYLLLVNTSHSIMLHAFYIDKKTGEKSIYLPNSSIKESDGFFETTIDDIIQFESDDKLIFGDYNLFNAWRRKGIIDFLNEKKDCLPIANDIENVGKCVKLMNGESAILFAITSTDEDFYNVFLMPDGTLTFSTALAAYKIVSDEVLDADLGRCKEALKDNAVGLANALYELLKNAPNIIIEKICVPSTPELDKITWKS